MSLLCRACVVFYPLCLVVIILSSIQYCPCQRDGLQGQERTKQLAETIELLGELQRIIDEKSSQLEGAAREAIDRMENDSILGDFRYFWGNQTKDKIFERIYNTTRHLTGGECALSQWIRDICRVRLDDEELDLNFLKFQRIKEQSRAHSRRSQLVRYRGSRSSSNELIIQLMVERHTSKHLQKDTFLAKPEDTYDEVMMRLLQGATDRTHVPESVLQWTILAVHSRTIENLLGQSWREQFQVTPLDTYETLWLKTRSLLELAKRHQEKRSSL